MAARAPSITRSIANRAVHVHILPRPQSIVESRELLRLLSRFGEVEYFRNLRYDREPAPNTAFAIFKDEDAAQYCIKKNRIRFRIDRSTGTANDDFDPFEGASSNDLRSSTDSAPAAQANQSSLEDVAAVPWQNQTASAPASSTVARQIPQGAFGLTHTRSLSTHSLPKPPRAPPSFPFGYASNPIRPPSDLRDKQNHGEEREGRQQEREQKPRVFQVFLNAAKHDFMKHIEMGHYHGGYVNDWRSAVNDDLRKRTPLKGMANLDWRMKTKSASTIGRERAAIRDRLGGLGEIYRQAQQQGQQQESASNTERETWNDAFT